MIEKEQSNSELLKEAMKEEPLSKSIIRMALIAISCLIILDILYKSRRIVYLFAILIVFIAILVLINKK